MKIATASLSRVARALPKRISTSRSRGGVLTVQGKREAEGPQKPSYPASGHRRTRLAQRQFQLAEHVEVAGARLDNGLLHIDLERIVPEEKKPRKIATNAPQAVSNGPWTTESAKAA